MLSLAAIPAFGQAVDGKITDRASGAPVAGITIVLLDSGNTPRAAALSNEQGRFIVHAPSAGLYRLRLDAVGVFSETTPELRVAERETLTQLVVFEGRVRDLPTITVTAKPLCVTAPNAGTVVAVLWDEVRKALAVTQLSGETESFRFDLLHYERELDPRTNAVRRTRSWESVGIGGQPYASIAAESLAAHGYVQTTADGTWYYAPDARTLLSDAFMLSHCLKPVPASADRSGLVGLAFEPTQQQKTADVRGVLWLDATTSRLRFLDYSYTGLPKSLRDHDFGGRVEFERLPSGAWVVQRWKISMPRLTRQSRAMPSGLPEVGPPRLVPVTMEVVTGIIERGGEVKAREPRTVALSARGLASIEGLVFDSTALGPLAQAEIWLDVPGQAIPAGRTVSDSAGRFRLDTIAPGTYTLTVTHSRLDALGTSLAPVTLNLERGKAVTLTLATPSLGVMVRSMCPAGLNDDASLMRGAVLRGVSGKAVPGARVVARWEGDALPPDSTPPSAPHEVSVTADESGHFTVCGLPQGRAVTLRATDARSRGEPLALTLGSDRIGAVTLVAPEHNAEISGVVSGRDGRPPPIAELRILDSEIGVRTDARGAYRIAVLPAGKHVLEARAVGYAPVRRVLELRADAADTVNFRLAVVAQTMKPVKTVASRDPHRTGFAARMARKTGGHFLTNDQIRKSGIKQVTELLRSVPGLQIRKDGNVSVMEFTGRGGRSFSSHGCPVAYALDGVPYEPASFGLDGEIGVENIEAIEVYDAATAPVQYSRRGTGCGVILIWTRETSVYEPHKKVGEDKDEPSGSSPTTGQKENEKKRP